MAEQQELNDRGSHQQERAPIESETTCCEGSLLVEVYSTSKSELDAIISDVSKATSPSPLLLHIAIRKVIPSC